MAYAFWLKKKKKAFASSSSMSTDVFNLPRTRRSSPIRTTRVWPSRFRCSAGQTGFFTKLGRLIKQKAKSDVDKLFSGFSKTRDNLAVIDELLLYWNPSDTDRVLDELEEALLVADFGPKITIKIAESLRDDIYAGKLKSGSETKREMVNAIGGTPESMDIMRRQFEDCSNPDL
ncbi:hypothetical protein CsSME_00024005 [Camellia sinensis var. sinensis]